MNSTDTESGKRQRGELLGHPKGLFFLSLTEMWERLSFYGMKNILVLFLIAELHEGGWKMEKETAYLVKGLYGALVYFMCIPTGFMADYYLGKRVAVLLGALCQCVGHLLLSLPADKMWFVYGIWFLGVGTGFLKTNISSLVGALYKEGDKRRDGAYYIFHQVLNVGAIGGGLLIPYVRGVWGYHAGFGAAGFFMVLSFIVFLMGWGYVPSESGGSVEQRRGLVMSLGGIVSGLVILFLAGFYVQEKAIPGMLQMGTDGIAGLLTVILMSACIWLYGRSSTEREKNRVMVICMAFLGVVMYVVTITQVEGLFVAFIKEKVDRHIHFLGSDYEIGPAYFQSLNPIFVILFAFPVSFFWREAKSRFRHLSVVMQQGTGILLFASSLGLAILAMRLADKGLVSLWWFVGINILIAMGELCTYVSALSAVNELSSVVHKSTIMGIFFGFTSLGELIGGRISGLTEKSIQSGGNFLWFVFAFFCAFGLVYMLLNNYVAGLLQEGGEKKK